MEIKFLSATLIAAFTAFQASAATKTLPTEPYVVDGYTPDTRSTEAKETYANRVVKSDVEGNNHSVFGQDNTVEAIHGSSSVYGNRNVVKVNAKDGNIFGDGSSITGYQSQAGGDNNHLVGEQDSAFGMNNQVNGNHTHAFGGGNNVTGDQSTATGHYNLVTGHNASAFGYDNKALANETTVVGHQSTASGLNASAFGSKATASGESSLALGSGANATADSAVAIGNDSNATGKSSVALGESTNATGVFATALGDSASALANGAVAISVDSKAEGVNSMALGRGATTTHDNSVAIGAGAVSKLENPVNSATIGTTTYLGFAGNNPVATFSVGAEGAERQIVNVAAGEISATSTDAINGSQLYAIAQAVENLATNPILSCVTVYSSDNNLNVETTGENEFDITLNKDLTGLNTITVNADSGDATTITTDGVSVKHYDNANGVEYTTTYDYKGVTIKTNDGNADNVKVVSVTVDGLDNGGNRISNVAEGVKDTDAVNVKQLNNAVASVTPRIDAVKAQTERNGQRINQLDKDIRKNRKRADAGTAAVAAMANIPQVLQAGKSGIGVGAGYKHGQSALAVGYSRVSDNAKHIIKLSAGIDTQKDVTIGAGYMYQY